MKKTLIVAALGAAFVAQFAAAEVTVYGSIRESLEYDQLKDAGGKDYKGEVQLIDQSSRFGFKGSDALDIGGKVIWQIESAIKTSGNGGTGNTTWGGRNTFGGWQGDWGTVRFGNYDSAYKTLLTSSDLSSLFDNFADTADYKGKGAVFAQLNSRLQNSVSYDSPKFGGFQVRGSWGLDQNAQEGNNSPIYAASALYSGYGFVGGLGYYYSDNRTFAQTTGLSSADHINADNSVTPAVKANTTSGASTWATNLALGYKFDFGLQLGGGWEHIDSDDGKAGSDWDNYAVVGNYKFGQFEVQGVYAWSKDQLGVSDNSGAQASLGLVYYATKQTRFYTYLVNLDNDSKGKFKNNSGSLTPDYVDQDGFAFSLGLRTDF
ncbi:porin [Jeongeupia naejangsanensis]|uniref:Porin n=1 Tax=Jeongeupia naejangsanensis TaxID=613195 RepID=A0ABS2BJ27_9NEIS|nr:porin [Jeongeupia naejangsanensis]MBM3115599.1 porin [Jeongeupia naejangsanensis]